MERVIHKVFYNNVLAFLILIFCYSEEIYSARILAYFPVPSISHQVVFRFLTQELAKRGHEVTIITPDPAFLEGKSPPNLFEIDVHDLSYSLWQEKVSELYQGGMRMLMMFSIIFLNEIFMAQVKSDQVKNILNNKNTTFDLVIAEACVETTLVLGYIYKVPVIHFSSLGEIYNSHDIIGSPSDALTYHQCFRKRIYNLNFLEQIVEYYNYLIIMKNFKHVEAVSNKLIRKTFGPNIPSLSKLKNNVAMLYLNVHPLWDNRPVPPGVAFIGGMQLTQQKRDISKDLKIFLDSSANGVMYVSFGSNVQLSALPSEKVQILLKVFSQLPYDVLLKCDLDVLEGVSDKVRLSKWFPQYDILGHHNVKAFVTQGGLQSTEEAITCAVPMIGIPINADQFLNTEHYVHYGIGIHLNIHLLTETNFKEAIITIMTNKSYYMNILKLRSWMRDQPQPPISRAVWWTEYVLRHGGAEQLRAPAANMPWAEKLELNLVLIIMISFSMLICFFLLITYMLIKLLRKCYYCIQKLYIV